jgi:cytochrome c biogenesis protein
MSVTRSNPEGAAAAPSHSIPSGIYSFLASVKFTILLLSLIAVGSIFGTVIKQRASVEEYLALYSESTYKFIKFLSLDDMYHSPWFYALIVLFVINLALCTLSRFSRFIRGNRRAVKLPEEDVLLGMERHFTSEKSYDEVIRAIQGRYGCIHREEAGLVLEKGTLSRYGVYIIHGSIVTILVGSFLGTLLGYRGYMVLHPGETKDQVMIRTAKETSQPLGFALKCKDFNVSFYPGGEPKDYVSTVEVVDNGKVVMEKKIRVNDPLSYKGIHVYQASYGRIPSFLFNVGGESVILRERDTYKKGELLLMVVRFEKTVHNFGPGVLVAYLDKGEPKTSWFLKDVARLREKQLAGVKIRLDEVREEFYTGLEVSRDPGVWVVWAGFALILFGLYVNFFMYHRRIYVRRTSKGTIVAGTVSRSRELFKKEFAEMEGTLYGME